MKSELAKKLCFASSKELERYMQKGHPPKKESLAGWIFHGWNTPFYTAFLRIRKFQKGFFWQGEKLFGFNTPVRQNRWQEPWIPKPSEESPKRFGFFLVSDVDTPYPSLLFDYSKGNNPWYAPENRLKDFLIQVEPDNEDVFLGKAYFTLGSLWLPVSYFVLERGKPIF